MNDADSCIYNFIFGLGKFKPFKISLLGGRFFASYAEIVPLINDQFISDYKSFLQEQLSIVTSFSRIEDPETKLFIEWILAYIEYELITTEYRALQTKYLESDFSKSFAKVLSSVFLDFFVFDGMPLDKKFTSFLARHKQLSPYFEVLHTHLDELPLTSLLDLDYICSNYTLFYTYLEDAFEKAEYPIAENPDFVAQKFFSNNFFESFHKHVSHSLLNFTLPELNIESRNEIFSKTIEYCYDSAKTITQDDLDEVIRFKDSLFDVAMTSFELPVSQETFMADLLKVSKKSPVSQETVKERYEQVFNEIASTLTTDYELFSPRTISFEPITQIQNFIGFSNTFISSSKTKRNTPAKFLINLENCYLSSIYVDILAQVIPFTFIRDAMSSTSYVYSTLTIPETERAIQLFFLVLSQKLGLTNSPEINAAIMYQLKELTQLAILDLQLVLQPDLDRKTILQRILYTTNKSDILAEILTEQLLFFPGSFYLSFLLFHALYIVINPIDDLQEQKVLVNKLFTVLRDYYGAPIKVLMKKIKSEFSN